MTSTSSDEGGDRRDRSEREAIRLVRAGYDRAAASYTGSRTTGGDVELLDAFTAALPRPCVVLDAGCGAGTPAADRLVASGLTVAGLDLSSTQLALARRTVPALPVVQGDMTALPFAAAVFDAVVSFYAVIHVPRELHPAVFAEFHRVLRPGGAVLLCLGAKDLPADHDPDSWLGVPMFWSHYDAETNLALLADAGFEVGDHRVVPDPMAHGGHLFVTATRG